MKLPRMLIGGTGSGCGKTTLTCALLQAFAERGLRAAAFKCGPDYIDPMFHSRVTGARSRNLDAFLCGRENIRRLLARGGADCDLALIEGVMGFYDGLRADSDENSAADLARLTETPAVLALNPRGMSLSAAALAGGYLRFRENTLKAVLLNGVSPASLSYYRAIIEGETGLPVLGALPFIPEAEIESRHLGLVTAEEIGDLREKLRLLARAARDTIDLDALLTLAAGAPDIETDIETESDFAVNRAKELSPRAPRLAVARDRAFCFHYADSLDLLRRLGAELVEFSPLRDAALPENCAGLLLCGGYPELWLDALSANEAMRAAIKSAVLGGMPTVAECGGFMYLHERIDGRAMAGVFRGEARMTKQLGRFGYVRLTAKRDNLLCRAGESLSAHEFHYSESDDEGGDFAIAKPGRAPSASAVHAGETLWAGYPHVHFEGNPEAARRFVRQIIKFSIDN